MCLLGRAASARSLRLRALMLTSVGPCLRGTSMTSRHAKVIIIGSGPAGYTAGIYAARAILKPLLIEGVQPGGRVAGPTDVENSPGCPEVIQGPWLMDQMRVQAEHVGTGIIHDHIVEVDLKRRQLLLKVDSHTEDTYAHFLSVA